MKNIASTQTEYNACFVTIMVSDMRRSIEFYTQRLGLILKSRYGDEFAVVAGPGVTIGLHPTKEAEPHRVASRSGSASTTSR